MKYEKDLSPMGLERLDGEKIRTEFSLIFIKTNPLKNIIILLKQTHVCIAYDSDFVPSAFLRSSADIQLKATGSHENVDTVESVATKHQLKVTQRAREQVAVAFSLNLSVTFPSKAPTCVHIHTHAYTQHSQPFPPPWESRSWEAPLWHLTFSLDHRR